MSSFHSPKMYATYADLAKEDHGIISQSQSFLGVSDTPKSSLGSPLPKTSSSSCSMNMKHTGQTSPTSSRTSNTSNYPGNYQNNHPNDASMMTSQTSSSSLVKTVPKSMNEWRQILSSYPLVILYIWKESCMPCTKVKPFFERLAQELYHFFSYQCLCVKEQIDYAHEAPDSSPQFAHWKMCQAVPFFIIYENGKIQHRITGFSEGEIRQKLRESIQRLQLSSSSK